MEVTKIKLVNIYGIQTKVLDKEVKAVVQRYFCFLMIFFNVPYIESKIDSSHLDKKVNRTKLFQTHY